MSMRPLRAGAVVLLAAVALSPRPAAQGLPVALFHDYLEALRAQTGVPAISYAIVQGDREQADGLGKQDVENSVAARADTPYLIGGLTQSFAAIVLGKCVERAALDVGQPIRRFTAAIPESTATVFHVLAHTSNGAPGESYRYDLGRYGALASVAEQCAERAFHTSVASDIFDRLGMRDSVPGRNLAALSEADNRYFADGKLREYEAVLRRLAVPYRVERSGRASRSEFPNESVTAGTGLVSTVRDLARFEMALDRGDLVRPELLAAAWTNATTTSGAPVPVGLGWFVQTYNGHRLIWQFGSLRDSGSSLVIKVPSRGLTLILLANSDGLASNDTLAAGDVTASLFAKLFLRLFLP
jgi:CubicO group peptidase (beta-lactamase class C family)